MKQLITIQADPSYWGSDVSDVWAEKVISHLVEIIEVIGFAYDSATMVGTTEEAIHYVRGEADDVDESGEEIIETVDWFTEFCGGSLIWLGDRRRTTRMIRDFGEIICK